MQLAMGMMGELLFLQPVMLSLVAVALLQLVKLALRPRQKTPPGPWKLPVVGSMHHLVKAIPHRALRELSRVHGPLMMLQLGETPFVVASSKETAREVLKTHDANFANRPKLLGSDIVCYESSDILFSPLGDYWRKIRHLCISEILSPKRVLFYRHIREEEVMARVEEIRKAGPSRPVNLTTVLHGLTNSIVSRAAFGKKLKNAPEFIGAIGDCIGVMSGFEIPDLFPTWGMLLATVTGMKRRLQGVQKTVDTTIQEIIEERRRVRESKMRSSSGNVEENLIDVLIGLQEKGGFTGFHLDNTGVKAIIWDMFAAGAGTSASAIEWGMSELMRNPAVMKKLQAQIREAFRGKAAVTEGGLQENRKLWYLKQVIKEVLRLQPPGPLLVHRESINVCEVNGYTIPAKSRVVVNAWAIGRDPEHWDAPEEFRPERFQDSAVDFMGGSFEFIPFGSGRRMCPGLSYGVASIELALASLLYHFDWALPEGVADLDMEEAPGIGVRRSCSAPPHS